MRPKKTHESVLTIVEVEAALKKLKNNKTPGIDLIQAELLKNTGPECSRFLYKLLVQIWTIEIIPEEWNLSII
jgi:hypothetical protein